MEHLPTGAIKTNVRPSVGGSGEDGSDCTAAANRGKQEPTAARDEEEEEAEEKGTLCAKLLPSSLSRQLYFPLPQGRRRSGTATLRVMRNFCLPPPGGGDGGDW